MTAARDSATATPPRTCAAIAAALRDAREYTLSLYAHLDAAARRFPCIPTVNPPGWELAHIGWFQEFWCRRHRFDDPAGARTPSREDKADAWWDSRRVPHDTRWSLPLPSWDEVHDYLAITLEDTLARLDASDGDTYAFELSLYHEDMHGEALLMSLQTLALPAPPWLSSRVPRLRAAAAQGDVRYAGGRFVAGSDDGDERDRFVFDNELRAHEVVLEPFALARAPVTQGQYAAFVRDRGYARPALWTPAGREWLAGARRTLPAYWRDGDAGFEARRFDRWAAIEPGAPMHNVNAFEAEAWCAWAGRRLPTEAEWEFAFRRGHGPMPGACWEWTSSPFLPYPGFVAHRYAEYSEPWFGTHRVLRGGSWATRPRLANAAFRNFYEPSRHDPFAGFRTCA